ncbi:MBL fold metallo-hydrolase [Nocardioides sp.]|uniref:MBL fold metallo-hydrolase n=1 Tax=Nocardioides sp. TaxID=35761 RepID=UPI00351912EC
MTDFTEIADRVWVLRHPWLDLNVTAIAGDRGLVLVDPHGSRVAGEEVLDALGRLASPDRRLVAAVNTHEHFDHTFGNGAVLARHPGVPVHATDTAAARTRPAGERAKREHADAAASGDARAGEVVATDIVAADVTFSSAAVIDLDDRQVELVHLGRGHTGGDLVVRVPDADVVLAGDLLEESAPPAYGDDSYPLEWASTLDLVLTLVTGGTVVVPGHGALVDRGFVEQQCDDIRAVGEGIRELLHAGASVDDVVRRGTWPFPDDVVAAAVRAALLTSPQARRRLPMAGDA